MSREISITSPDSIQLNSSAIICPAGGGDGSGPFGSIPQTKVLQGDKVNITFDFPSASSGANVGPHYLYATVQEPNASTYGFFNILCGAKEQNLSGSLFEWTVEPFDKSSHPAGSTGFQIGASLVWTAIYNDTNAPPRAYWSNNFTLVAERSSATAAQPLGLAGWLTCGLLVLASLQAVI